MLDTIAFMVVIYFSYKSEKSPDKPELGPFRIKVDAPVVQTAPTRATNLRATRAR